MRVSEAMHTPAVSIGPGATLREAAEVMRDRNVGCLIVLDDMGYLVGIVTDRDVTLRGVGEGRSVDAPVEAVMTRDVMTVSPHEDLNTAERMMLKKGVRRLPVTDEMWRPHGLVSMDDVLRTLGHEIDSITGTVRSQTSGLTV